MIITPIILPSIPNPSLSDCDKLLSYTNFLIADLETVLDKLYEVSSYPDEAMTLIRIKVETMLSEAKRMKVSLNSIKSESIKLTR